MSRERLSPESFGTLYRASWNRLWCIAVAILGDRNLADDAMQEAAVIGLHKINAFQPGSSFEAWMGQIVRNVSRNMRRKQRRGPALSEDLDHHERPPSEPVDPPPVGRDGSLDTRSESFDDRVLRALEALDDIPRACLLLRTIEDVGYREIAALLDIPEGTAMSHVHRARQEMRRRLSETGD